MPTIQISILPDLMPVEKYEPNEDGDICPLATQDDELNTANMEAAIEEADYRDPADGGAFRVTDACGNCKFFDTSEDMLDCIGDDSGELGFCQKFSFVCEAGYTCDEWVEEGEPVQPSDDSSRDVF